MSSSEAHHLFSRRLAALPTAKQSLFYASCAERYQGFYGDAMAAVESATAFAAALGALWDERCPPVDLQVALRSVEDMLPAGETTDAARYAVAEAACICLDAGLRYRLGDTIVSPSWVQYPLDAIKSLICIERTGFVDLGSTEDAKEFEISVSADPRYRRELEMEEADLVVLNAIHEWRMARDILRQRSQAHVWKLTAFKL